MWQDLLERCLNREHRSRPTFVELAAELRELIELAQQGVDMEEYVTPIPVSEPASRRWRSLSLGSRQAKYLAAVESKQTFPVK